MRYEPAVCTENLNTGIVVMKSAQVLAHVFLPIGLTPSVDGRPKV
jgi:hypothetical protein